MENLIWCSNFGPYDFSKRLLWNIIFPSKENFLIMRCHCLAVPASKSTIGFLYSKQKTKTVGTFPVFSSSVPYSQELTFLHFLKGYSTIQASLVAQLIKNLPAMRETWVWSLGWEDPLEKGKYKNSPEFWPGELHGLCVCVCVCVCVCIHAVYICIYSVYIYMYTCRFNKTWSTGEGNGKPLQYSCLEKRMNSMKRQKGITLKDELLRS